MSALAAAGTIPAAVTYRAACPACGLDAVWTARRLLTERERITSESGRSDVACRHCDTEER